MTDVKVTAVVSVTVDEQKWKNLMASKGLETNVIVSGFLCQYIKALVENKFAELGFPQGDMKP